MRGLAILLLGGAIACGPKEQGPPVGVSDKPGAPLPDRPVTYTFNSIDERPVSSDAMKGKPTVIVFTTTGDALGQAQVDFLIAMQKNDKDKINYALVALHPRREISLVDAYAVSLHVEFPVALAEPSTTMGGAGPFGPISEVPTVVVLDRQSKMVWKHTGLAKSDELRAHMHGL